MTKVVVTPELAGLIKSLRLEKGTSAQMLARHIKKSGSYITKLEKAEIKTIDELVLRNILLFISDDKQDFEAMLEKISSMFRFKFSEEEIEEQLWFYNFDTVYRLIPVPEELVDAIIDRMEKCNISTGQIVSRINANEHIPDNLIDFSKSTPNMWVHKKNSREWYIYMQVEEQDISKILNKETSISNYVTMQAIVLYLTKIEEEISERNEIDFEKLAKKTEDFLLKHKYYTLSHKSKIQQTMKSVEEQRELLSNFDIKNNQMINEMISMMKIFSDINVIMANDYIEGFVQNLKWDTTFSLKMSSLPFAKLDKTSYTLKSKLLFEIQEILDKYLDIPAEKRILEEY